MTFFEVLEIGVQQARKEGSQLRSCFTHRSWKPCVARRFLGDCKVHPAAEFQQPSRHIKKDYP